MYPEHFQGECCETCRAPPTACTEPCGERSVCKAGACVSALRYKIIMTLKAKLQTQTGGFNATNSLESEHHVRDFHFFLRECKESDEVVDGS